MKIRELSTSEWIDVLKEYPAKTFFELPAWYEIWSQYLNVKTTTFLLDDDILVSVIKLKGAKGLIEFRNSGPVGTYSNLQSLSRRNIQEREIRDILSVLKISLLRLSPYQLVEKITKEAEDQFTQVVRLSAHYDLTSIWSRNHIRQLQKAQEYQYDITIAKPEEWKEYIQLYQDFVTLKGSDASNRYEASLFILLSQLPHEKCKLWIAKDKGDVVSGRLVFYHSTQAVEWHAASTSASSKQGVNQLLIHHIMEEAKVQGMSIYDFNPSGGHEGVVDFKAKFGSKRLHCPVIKSHRPLQNLYVKYTKS